jgi:mannose-6-phosphate isomerase-like protein (cupin superfamily)
MMYPDPRYRGEGGEVSGVFRLATTGPDLKVGASGAHYLAKGEDTGGQFGLYRWDMAPGTPGAAPHFHRTISESFFIVSGSVGIFNGEDWIETGPGDFVYVPEGGLHGFRNASNEPASMLILFVPGAPREGYFEGLADVAAGRRQFTPEEFREFCERHDNYFV